MIIEIDSLTSVDTDRDLSAEERHILQKLFGWKSLAKSVAEFRQKKEAAFIVGWNNSGPVRESSTMELVAKKLEAEVRLRLAKSDGDKEC